MTVQRVSDGVQLPEQFGHYRIVKRLGQGGMGTVFLAQDTRLNRRVALKVCHIAANHPQALERFRREAQAAASLRHANLCPVYDCGEQDGVHYFTMAHIEGPSLGEWLARRPPLSQRESALFVRKLALAMQEAHARGVIHRDLKPANIILERGEPVILDFGLAGQAVPQGERLTKLGAVMGTPSYMAPEQVGGDPAKLGPGCDVYALGVILYELLTGRVPFEGPPLSIVAQLLKKAPPPLRELRTDVNPQLEAACLKALAKEPEGRFPSMAEMARVLSDCVRTLPASATPAATKLARPQLPAATKLVPAPPTLAEAPAPVPKRPPIPEKPRQPSTRPWVALLIGGLVGLTLLGTIIGIVWAVKSREPSLEKSESDRQAELNLDKKSPVPNKPDQTKPDPIKPDPIKPDPIKPEPFRPDPIKPEPIRPEPFRPDPIKPELRLNRSQPELFTPVEGRIAIVQGQLWSYMFRVNEKTNKLEIKVKSTDQPGVGNVVPPNDPRRAERQAIAQRFTGVGGARAVQAGRAILGDQNRGDVVERNEAIRTEYVPVDTLADNPKVDQPLRTIRPVRMAVIAASFPLKAQVEEFRKKLRMDSLRAVLEEASAEEIEAEGAERADPQRRQRESFRFINVVVERRQIDRMGKPIFMDSGPYKNGWEPLDVVDAYKPLLVLSNLQTEEEDKTLEPVIMDGLVMPRLYSARADQYPAIERELKTIEQTLADLAKAKTSGALVPTIRNFEPDKFDPFSGNSRNRDPIGTPKALPPGPAIKPRVPVPGPGRGPRGPIGSDPPEDKLTLPEHCLIRVIDVTVKPAESYQYRIRVNMANPNYGRQDVVDPRFAEPKEENKILKLSPGTAKEKMWFEIPGIVTVPSEMYYYAVDQKTLEKDSYRGAFASAKVGRDQIVLQIHKYLENAAPGKGRYIPVGDWSVAERVIVSRYEVIDRLVRVEVPVLVEEEGKWKLASTAGIELGKPREPGIDVPFNSMPLPGWIQRQAIMVDFEGRYQYKRAGADKPVLDLTPQEVLILGPDGKLLAHNAGIDAADRERIERYREWQKRIDEVRRAMQADPMNPRGVPVDQFGRPIRRPFDE